jgi:hypothetical protein
MSNRILAGFAFFALLGLGLSSETCLRAQEVAYIDLTQIEARMDLRRPAVPAGATETPRGASNAIYGCKGGGPMKGALRTTLLSLDRTQYQADDNPVFEVSIENIGTEPLQIPISAHLADLQPADPGARFSYFELLVTRWLGGPGWSTTSAVVAKLYGREDHADSMLTLQPGERVRVRSKGNFGLHLNDEQIRRFRRQDPVDHANAKTAVTRTDMLLGPTSTASMGRLECLISRMGPDVSVTVSEATQ